MDFLSILKAEMRRESLFAMIMMAAATFGFVKVFSVATLLETAEFGHYVSMLGVATFLGILVSLGRVEATTKLYPVVVDNGRSRWIAPHAARLCVRLGVVTTLLTLGGVVFSEGHILPFDMGWNRLDFLIVGLTGWLAACMAVMASIIRALGSSAVLQIFTAARGAIILVGTVPIAWSSGSWRATLLAEAISMGVVLTFTAIWTLHRLRNATDHGNIKTLQGDVSAEYFKGGGFLYLSGLMGAAVPYGGRPVILLLAGPTVVAGFGLISVIGQIGLMLAGALAQKIGPQLIRDASKGKLRRASLVTPVAIMALAAALGTICLSASFLFPTARAFWEGYGIGQGLVLAIGLQIFMPVHFFLQFFLTALHKEGCLLKSTTLAVAVFFAGVYLVSVMDWGLVGYVIAMIVADSCRLCVLAICASRNFGK